MCLQVPIGQMTSVVRVANERAAFKRNQFVRLTRGHYKGDLAQVRSVLNKWLSLFFEDSMLSQFQVRSVGFLLFIYSFSFTTV